MTLAAGTQIGPYEVLAPIGAGGMGEVYRARDTRLGRDVALKVLPAALSGDADYMARFRREAQVLASLNHPHIAIIHGLEEADGVRALAMELVEGPTIEERIRSGPLAVAEALDIARQIAEALEAAHEKGIVHRDLKPANVKVTPEGVVKVLDFGLAKTVEGSGGGSDISNSPTLTMRATQAGIIMGTAGYMAPEQAAGLPVDKRADIWAFGVVFYEMLGGKRLFEGETVAHTLADVLRAEIDLSRLPEETPRAVRKLIGRCLERKVKKRLRDIGEARILLEDVPAEEAATAVAAVAPAVAGRRGVPIWAGAALAAVALAAGVMWWRATRPVLRPMMRFSADLGRDALRGIHITTAISPDGTRIVFPVRTGSATMLATQLLDQPRYTVLSGTEAGVDPFFSPDGEWIGFFADQKMKKISVLGGAAVTLCDGVSGARGAAWGDDGTILATLDLFHLFRVPAAGGKAEMLAARPEDHGERTWRWPQILPGAENVLLTAGTGPGGYESANLEVLSLRTGKLTVVQRGGYFGRYLPSGHLIYGHQGTLFAVPFDLAGLKMRGTPAPVLEDLAGEPAAGSGQLDFARNGTFVYVSGKSGGSALSPMWMDAAGKSQPLMNATPNAMLTPRLSPDGALLAAAMQRNIVVYDPKRDATTPLTFNGAGNIEPLWMPDGKHIVFLEQGTPARIWWTRSDGSGQPEKLFEYKSSLGIYSIAPDGRRIAFYQDSPETNLDLWTLPLDLSDPDHPKPGQPEPFLREPALQLHSAFSPDGRWMAYMTTQGGTSQIFVRPFPSRADGGKWQISTDGGDFPAWSKASKELLYLGPSDRIMAVSYAVKGDSLIPDKPRLWCPTPVTRTGTLWNFDLAPDGKRVVAFPQAGADGEKGPVHVTVLVNFFDELRRKVPVK